MAKKINEQNLKDVNGGAKNGFHCDLCYHLITDEYYSVTVTNSQGKKNTLRVCIGHYDGHKNDPQFSDWKRMKV